MSALAAPQHSAQAEHEAARLFEEHSRMLFGFCVRRLGSRSDAEDAVQTTFLHAFRALARGIVPESEAAWLTAIATNVCRAQLRTRGRRGFASAELDLDRLPASSPVESHDRELCGEMCEALASLPDSQRRALVLREWHGLSSRDVAAHLEISPAATYALLTRARHSFVKALTALPQRAALGLAAFVYDIRAQLRALHEGVVTKAVATTTVVATVAVVGASTPPTRVHDDPSLRSSSGEAALTDAGAAPAGIGTAARRAQRARAAVARREAGGGEAPTPTTVAGPTVHENAASATPTSEGPTSAPEPTPPGADVQPPGTEPLPALPPAPGPLPEVELPSEVPPLVELPPIPPPAPPPPSVEVPSVELPLPGGLPPH
jgi:RNA polymerase sigma factor (sigma-70 family)